jgi:hypothetical protein
MKNSYSSLIAVATVTFFTASQLWAAKDYFAAGILPYAVNPETKKIEFLLSQEQNRSWSDFGGRRDHGEHDPKETALREYTEESMGLLGSKKEMRQLLKQRTTFFIGQKRYKLYLVQVPYQKIEKIGKSFASLKKRARAGYSQEKRAIGWFSADKIFKAISESKKRNRIGEPLDVVQGVSYKSKTPRRLRSTIAGCLENFKNHNRADYAAFLRLQK